MSKHTPTPWSIGSTVGLRKTLLTKEGAMVAKVLSVSELHAHANAALIVRAVNCHAELVDFLKDRLEVMTFPEDVENRLIDLLARARGEA